jgi:hypothetical protein
MAWSDAQQTLARAVYAAAKRVSKYAPMDHTVSVGNVLLRVFDRHHLFGTAPKRVQVGEVNKAALMVRDAGTDRNRFSGSIPAFSGGPLIAPERSGAFYCAKDVRAQMAEMLHYTPDHATRAPGSLQFVLQALHGKCMVLIKPTTDIHLVTLNADSGGTSRFFDELQRADGVRAALTSMRYTDITQAIFSPTEYSAARGLGLGLMSNPAIDGIEIDSARSFETITDGAAASIFRTGSNVLLFGRSGEVLSDRLRVVSLYLLDSDERSGWCVRTLQSDGHGAFSVSSTASL